MSSGCHPEHLNFSNYLYAIKISGIDYNYQMLIQFLYYQNVVKREVNGKGLVMYFGNEGDRKDFKTWLDIFRKEHSKFLPNINIKI